MQRILTSPVPAQIGFTGAWAVLRDATGANNGTYHHSRIPAVNDRAVAPGKSGARPAGGEIRF